MIEEIDVLLGIEHFQQRRSRIALIGSTDLVDLVEHDHRIGHAAFLDRLNELARHGADIGTSVALDFGLVAHAAEGETVEFSSQGIGDGSADGSLADAGRAHQQKNGTGNFALERTYGKELDDAFLDVVETIVIVVEDLARTRQIELVFGKLAPRQLAQPVEVVARHRIFR